MIIGNFFFIDTDTYHDLLDQVRVSANSRVSFILFDRFLSIKCGIVSVKNKDADEFEATMSDKDTSILKNTYSYKIRNPVLFSWARLKYL